MERLAADSFDFYQRLVYGTPELAALGIAFYRYRRIRFPDVWSYPGALLNSVVTALVDAGYDVDRVLGADDLVSGEDLFVAATGVTDGALLRGVRFEHGIAATGVDYAWLGRRDGLGRCGGPSRREFVRHRYSP